MRPSKRDELITRALPVFRSNGYHATGMDLLAKEVGMSKTSLYNHFPTKQALIAAVLDRRHAEFMDNLNGYIQGAEDKLSAIFIALKDWFATPGFQGCDFIRAVAEHPEPTDPIRIASVQHKRDVEALIKPIGGAATPGLMLLIEGAIIRAQMGLADDPAGDALAAARVLMDDTK